MTSLPNSWASVTDMTIVQHPIGTLLYFVPIRFWEMRPIETGTVALHTTLDGRVLDSFTHDGFVYAYHNGYGHEVYMRAEDVYLTVEGAMRERHNRARERRRREARDMDALMRRIYADRRGS